MLFQRLLEIPITRINTEVSDTEGTELRKYLVYPSAVFMCGDK